MFGRLVLGILCCWLLVCVFVVCCILLSYLWVVITYGLFRFLWLLWYYGGLLYVCVADLFWLRVIVCLDFG